MTNSSLVETLVQLEAYNQASGQRSLVLVIGEPKWQQQVFNQVFDYYQQQHKRFWQYHNDGEQHIHQGNFRHYLGQECDALWFSQADFFADAFAALTGCVCAPGLVFIAGTEAEINARPVNQSLFFSRFYRLALSQAVILSANKIPAIENKYSHKKVTSNQVQFDFGAVTEDQQHAVAAMLKVATGHRNRPLVLTADRGRGKTTAIGLAIAELFTSTAAHNIVLTAPNKAMVQGVFSTLKRRFTDLTVQRNCVCYQQHQLSFIALDKLVSEKPKASLVIVDEAAGIPVYQLLQVLSHYSRLVFSTTIHGYEGAGRGFAHKFLPLLQQQKPEFCSLQINQPIRWCQGDLLEQFVFNACLLNAELAEHEQAISVETAKSKIAHITGEQLMNHESLLNAVIALLVNAHYQTSANDLVLMLDNQQAQLYVLYHHQLLAENVLAVAFIMQEGQQSLAEDFQITDILHSKRRYKNQFLPQSLLAHCGHRTAFHYQYWRIVRIAVLPQWQQQGLGQHFFKLLANVANQQQIDFIGASFGANTDLLAYWQSVGCKLIRLGFSQDQASGEHSAIVLSALNEAAQKQLQLWQRAFQLRLLTWLSAEFSTIAPSLVKQIVSEWQIALPLTDFQQDVTDFQQGIRQLSPCVLGLQSWLIESIRSNKLTDSAATYAMIQLILQKHTLAQVCQAQQFTGKKQLIQALKHLVSTVNLGSET